VAELLFSAAELTSAHRPATNKARLFMDLPL
jgi:hypothetical protein